MGGFPLKQGNNNGCICVKFILICTACIYIIMNINVKILYVKKIETKYETTTTKLMSLH